MTGGLCQLKHSVTLMFPGPQAGPDDRGQAPFSQDLGLHHDTEAVIQKEAGWLLGWMHLDTGESTSFQGLDRNAWWSGRPCHVLIHNDDDRQLPTHRSTGD